MRFSRDRPSAQYASLVAAYRKAHAEGASVNRRTGDAQNPLSAAELVSGDFLKHSTAVIRTLVAKHGARSILDYGAGSGRQYEDATVKALWGVDAITCYDPCWPQHDVLPGDKSDGVISTEVLQLCPEQDIPWMVEEMFTLAHRFVFVQVSSYKTVNTLADGTPMHVTVWPPERWFGLFIATGARFADVDYMICCSTPERKDDRETGKFTVRCYPRKEYG